MIISHSSSAAAVKKLLHSVSINPLARERPRLPLTITLSAKLTEGEKNV